MSNSFLKAAAGNSAMNERLDEAVKNISGKGRAVTLQYINESDLIDCPFNSMESVAVTSDLETSMKENGFTDPLEVTTFGMKPGKFMIVSGHRRRAAARKVGIEKLPCIVKTFDNDNEVQNYVLLANSHRDSDNDPLLRVRRYKMHEEYLKKTGYRGKLVDEIARRMGISAPQVARYRAICKTIEPVWDMMESGAVGLSSIVPLSAKAPDEQLEIVGIMRECLDAGDELTRERCRQIYDRYGAGARTYADVRKAEEPPEPAAAGEEPAEPPAQEPEAEAPAQPHSAGPQAPIPGEPPQKDALERKKVNGRSIRPLMEKVSHAFDNVYVFESDEAARQTLRAMLDAAHTILAEADSIKKTYGIEP